MSGWHVTGQGGEGMVEESSGLASWDSAVGLHTVQYAREPVDKSQYAENLQVTCAMWVGER